MGEWVRCDKSVLTAGHDVPMVVNGRSFSQINKIMVRAMTTTATVAFTEDSKATNHLLVGLGEK